MKRCGGGLARKTSGRQPRRKCFVFCEGANTEPDYLAALKAKFPRSLFDIVSIKGAGVPATLLEKALEQQKEIAKTSKKGRSFAGNDDVWIAFDRDDHPKVRQTRISAEANKVGVAFSNPCFELWLILHKEDFDRSDDRHQIQRTCEDILECYSRKNGKSGDFTDLLDSLEDAEARAERQIAKREEEDAEGEAPSTTFYLLTRRLRAP